MLGKFKIGSFAIAGCMLAAAALTLSACGNQTAGPVASTQAPATATAPAAQPASKMATIVSDTQAFYADIKSDAAFWLVLHPEDAATVTKVEGILDPEIAALSGDSPPTTISAALTDIKNQVAALPSGLISTTHQVELDTLLDLAQGALLF